MIPDDQCLYFYDHTKKRNYIVLLINTVTFYAV